MQNALHTTVNWATDVGLGVNPDKTEVVIFSRKHTTPNIVPFRGIPINISEEAKYLGLILDRKLSWKKNCQERATKATIALYTCKNAIALDSPVRNRVYAAMSELSIPAKLIRRCRMTLSNSCSSDKVEKDLCEPFRIVQGFRQGDQLSATSSIFSWRVCYGRRVCIAMALFSTKVFSFLRKPTALTLAHDARCHRCV